MLHICPYRAGRERYQYNVAKATLTDLWGRITGGETNLVRFEAVTRYLHSYEKTVKGIQYVPLDQIVGSVGRASDFTRNFLPRAHVECERWAQIDARVNLQKPLPPVELYQIGSVYFVHDGHHRISVARANGLADIEALVVELASPVPLTVADFQRDRWINKFEQANKEKTMYYVIDPELAKREYAERLQRAEHERLCLRMIANQPSRQARIRQSLGNLLVAVGMRLKAQAQPELVELV